MGSEEPGHSLHNIQNIQDDSLTIEENAIRVGADLSVTTKQRCELMPDVFASSGQCRAPWKHLQPRIAKQRGINQQLGKAQDEHTNGTPPTIPQLGARNTNLVPQVQPKPCGGCRYYKAKCVISAGEDGPCDKCKKEKRRCTRQIEWQKIQKGKKGRFNALKTYATRTPMEHSDEYTASSPPSSSTETIECPTTPLKECTSIQDKASETLQGLSPEGRTIANKVHAHVINAPVISMTCQQCGRSRCCEGARDPLEEIICSDSSCPLKYFDNHFLEQHCGTSLKEAKNHNHIFNWWKCPMCTAKEERRRFLHGPSDVATKSLETKFGLEPFDTKQFEDQISHFWMITQKYSEMISKAIYLPIMASSLLDIPLIRDEPTQSVGNIAHGLRTM